jgi:hypothetical protein
MTTPKHAGWQSRGERCPPPRGNTNQGVLARDTRRVTLPRQDAGLVLPSPPNRTDVRRTERRLDDHPTLPGLRNAGHVPRIGDATCPGCGLPMYVTKAGQVGRYPEGDWTPGYGRQKG